MENLQYGLLIEKQSMFSKDRFIAMDDTLHHDLDSALREALCFHVRYPEDKPLGIFSFNKLTGETATAYNLLKLSNFLQSADPESWCIYPLVLNPLVRG